MNAVVENTRLRVLEVLDSVCDPEIPTVSIRDLGIVRAVDVCDESGTVQVQVMITPTYSGCPAMQVIEQDIHEALGRAGIDHVAVEQVLYPPWTTDWITDQGRRHLLATGITPPACRPIERFSMNSVSTCLPTSGYFSINSRYPLEYLRQSSCLRTNTDFS